MPKNFRQEQIKGVIQNSNSFAILTHERPDGDAISSALAMYWYIKSNLSDVEIDIIIPEYPKSFTFYLALTILKQNLVKNNMIC
ncbi:MAG: DHH family phosphoesterase [Clostridia bacterium]